MSGSDLKKLPIKMSKWIFNKEQLKNSPSARSGISGNQEQEYKQLTAFLISDIGNRLKVSQSCINTAIVYMHRFYVYHPQTIFKKCSVACVSLFLASKVKEFPIRPEKIVQTMHICMKNDSFDEFSDEFKEQVGELITNELILLMTLGFATEIEHPHPYVFEFCQKIRLSKEFSRLADKIATHCLQLTSMCLRYTAKDLAIFCLHFTAKLSNLKIKDSKDGSVWFHSLNSKFSSEILRKMEKEFKAVLDSSPLKFKKRVLDLFKGKFIQSTKKFEKPEKSKISFKDYVARKDQEIVEADDGNNNFESNDGNNNNLKSSVILKVSMESVDLSNEFVKSYSSVDSYTSSVRGRKRKSNVDLDKISSPRKKFKPSWIICYDV